MKRVELADAAELIAEYAQERVAAPVILINHGTPVAVVIPLQGMDWETVAVSTSPTFRAIMERARARRKAEGGISHDELLRRLGMDARPGTDNPG